MKWLLAFLKGWFSGQHRKGTGGSSSPVRSTSEEASASSTGEPLSELYERVWERIEADKEARRQAKYDALLGQVFSYTLRPYSETQLPSPTVPLGAHPLCDQIVIAECTLNVKLGTIEPEPYGENCDD